MPKATRSSNAPHPALQGEAPLSPRDAAGQIIDLINSRPVTPWPAEIEAIVARAVGNAPTAQLAVTSPLAIEARALLLEHQTGPTDARREEITGRLLDLSEQVWSVPAVSLDDVRLRAELARHWNDNWRPFTPSSDPECCDRKSLHALAEAVLGFIRAGSGVINPPGILDIVLAAIARTKEAANVLNNTPDDPKDVHEEAEDAYHAALDALKAIQLPDPPASLADVIAHAEVTAFWADDHTSDDPFDVSALRLVDAVRKLGTRTLDRQVSPLGLQIREQIKLLNSIAVGLELEGVPEDHWRQREQEIGAKIDIEEARLAELLAQLPRGELTSRAEIAYYWSDQPFDENEGDAFDRAAKRLIVDVLAAAGVTPTARPSDFSAEGGASHG